RFCRSRSAISSARKPSGSFRAVATVVVLRSAVVVMASALLGQEHNLAGMARGNKLEGLVKLAQRQPVRDDWSQVKPLLQERGSPVPRLEHPAAGDAVHADALEDDFVVEIQRDGPGRQSQE